ncbi:MAG: hypothetical protein WBD58_22090 [Geitlerinemataceae cyanobacterium]
MPKGSTRQIPETIEQFTPSQDEFLSAQKSLSILHPRSSIAGEHPDRLRFASVSIRLSVPRIGSNHSAIERGFPKPNPDPSNGTIKHREEPIERERQLPTPVRSTAPKQVRKIRLHLGALASSV